jgi:hypothetical protein
MSRRKRPREKVSDEADDPGFRRGGGDRHRGRAGRLRQLEQQLELGDPDDVDAEHELSELRHRAGRQWRGRRRRLLVLRLAGTKASVAATLAAALAVSLAGCGGSSNDESSATRASVEAYVAQVEPIRQGTNRLLDRADPILSAYHEHRLSARKAQQGVQALEHRLSDYAVRIAAVAPVPPALEAVQSSYAHVWVLQDSYLSALAQAIPERDFEDLPNYENRQRVAITAWRIGLEAVADRAGAKLPKDIQIAGRGEIRPSPIGD